MNVAVNVKAGCVNDILGNGEMCMSNSMKLGGSIEVVHDFASMLKPWRNLEGI